MANQCRDNGAGIAHRHGFFDQPLQHLGHSAKRQQLGHQPTRQRGRSFSQRVEHGLHFILPDQAMGMRAKQLVEVGADHRSGIDDGIACRCRQIGLVGRNPARRQAKGRVTDGAASNFGTYRPCRDGEYIIGKGHVLTHDYAADGYAIGKGRQRQIIPHADLRQHKAQLFG